MAKYLIIDDVFDQWEGYKLYLDRHQQSPSTPILRSLEAHERNTFIEGGYDAIKAHLREVIEQDNLSLLITDISLGGQDDAKNPKMWVTTILKELIKESVTIRRILRRRGIGLILVTQHHADVLNRIIQDNQQFLAQYFPNTWRYIASEEFDDRIVKTIEDIGQYFEELAGRWFHVDRLEEYFHEIGRRERYFAPIEGSNGIIRLRFDQIVSIEVSPDKSIITYLPNLHVKQLASLETRDLQLTNEENQDIAFMTFMEIGAIDISAYRRGQLPEGFYPVNEYFLQARRRNPLTFINNSLTWHVAAHPNRGRILQFLEKKIHCNFTCLNSYFKL